MRYKTKKYLWKSTRYLLNILVFSLAYIIFAHKGWLPALFEAYTGEITRQKTQDFYDYYAFYIEGETKGRQKQKLDFHDILDLVTSESTYLYAQDVLNALSTEADYSKPFKKEAMQMASHPGLLEWLGDQKGRFAEVFKFEFSRYAQSSKILKNVQVLNHKGEVIWGKTGKKTAANIINHVQKTDFYIDNELFIVKIQDNDETIGYLTGYPDRFGYKMEHFQIPQLGYGVAPVLIDPSGKTVNIQELDKYGVTWVKNSKYLPAQNGKILNARVLSRKIGNYKLVLIYKARPWYFYVMELLFIIVIPVTLVIFVLYLRTNMGQLIAWVKRENRNREILEEAIILQKESIQFSKECEQKMVQMKVTEIEKLRLIGRHLESLHAGLERKNSENKLLNEVV